MRCFVSALTKAVLRTALIEKLGFDKQEVFDFVDDFFKEIAEALVSGDSVKLSGFGNFVLNDKNARPGRNPKTGQDFEIAARKVVTFKVGGKLQDLLESNTHKIAEKEGDNG